MKCQVVRERLTLPDDLRDPSLSADNFRKKLKTHLFRNALGHLAHKRRCVMRCINLRLTYLLTYLLNKFLLRYTGCFKKAPPKKKLFGIVSLRLSFCVKFCKFVGISCSDIFANFCRFILIFHQMALIFP